MKTPRFLLGATLLFWGWQSGLLLWATPMAILLEASFFIHTRWDFSTADLKRIWNLCVVLFFGMGIILYSSEEIANVALKFAQWIPFPFLPIMLAQAYGSSEKMPMSVFSWFLRRSPERPLAKKTLNISFLYFGLCLLAASATSEATTLFYPAIVLLMCIALMANRPKRLSPSIWIILIAVVALAGHVGHQQLRALHSTLEGELARWFVSLFNRQGNLNESQTAIGRIGRIQLSGNIVFRVQPESGDRTPSLLRDASYDTYRNGVWRGTQNDFTPVFVDTNDVAVLQTPKKLNFSVRIAGYLKRGRGYLVLPQGAYEIHEIPAILYTNRLGVAKVEAGPGLLNLVAFYGPGSSSDARPGETDLEIPENEKSTVTALAHELNLEGKSEREKLETIKQFFAKNFSYSLQITRKHIDRSGQKTPLGQFLATTRSGHCEYFATATVMLLRAAKIPARYATGYVVDDSSRHGKTYLVRERDAHAWVLVFREDKGIWEEFDTTPASDRAEAFHAAKWEPVSDFFANLKFQFSKWRWSKTTYTSYLKWFLIPLVLFLIWRIVSNKRRRQKNALIEGQANEPTWPGMDSELYLLNEKLSSAGLGRFPNELLNEWHKRISPSVPQSKSLSRIFQIHRRLRFDPNGITPDNRHLLKSEVHLWLDRFPQELKKDAE